MKIVKVLVILATVSVLTWCAKKKKDEPEASTVEADKLILPMNLKCGDKPCIN